MLLFERVAPSLPTGLNTTAHVYVNESLPGSEPVPANVATSLILIVLLGPASAEGALFTSSLDAVILTSAGLLSSFPSLTIILNKYSPSTSGVKGRL